MGVEYMLVPCLVAPFNDNSGCMGSEVGDVTAAGAFGRGSSVGEKSQHLVAVSVKAITLGLRRANHSVGSAA